MVGFGSSLRLARRPGWERAYLEYETLKMLLSQIEAVYEEEAHRQEVALGDTSPRAKKRRKNYDYRDELFLEEDSDKAFLSSDDLKDEELGGSGDLTIEEDLGRQTDASSTAKPFTLSYSHEIPSEGEESPDVDTNCGSGLTSFGGWGAKKNDADTVDKTRRLPARHEVEADDYFLTRSRLDPQQHTFLVEDQDGRAQETSSLLTGTSTKRKKPSAVNDQGRLISFGEGSDNFSSSITPPEQYYGSTSNWSSVGTNVDLLQPNLGVTSQSTTGSAPTSTLDKKKQSKLEKERQRKRRQRRRRLQKKRQERDKRVPRHIRVAHGKARAITERFLGLLRAEVEKVTLFAQSRLGELADVSGSLRFPSYDGSEFGGSFSSEHQRRIQTGSFEHPLSDGGMHPSASSSEDERKRSGVFSWSDSSDDDEGSDSSTGPRATGSHGLLSPSRKASSAGLSVATETFSNLTGKNGDVGSPGSNEKDGEWSNEASNLAVQRQITHFTELRMNRPVFQRLDHIVGEDLLLLSAVDEADGYTAVGVELMHILRYISVNVIAVRKICRKHDRLLMNRMLGGYYHRKRKRSSEPPSKGESNDETTQITLGGLVSQSLGDKCVDSPAAASDSLEHKLEGVFDVKIQQLANSNTVQVISSCIALALSEYEVSQSRADALAKLNPAVQHPKTPIRSGGLSESEPEGPCSPNTATFGLSPSRWRSKKHETDDGAAIESASHSMDEGDWGPPLSLTRLRFTVVSIFALREVARMKRDSYQTFVSRTSLVFTGPNVVGEGLDGCSRETLDFFVAYNPDCALLFDSAALHKGIGERSWRNSGIGSVMLAALAVAVSNASSESGHREAALVNAVSIKPSADQSWTESRVSNSSFHAMQLGSMPSLDAASLSLNRISAFLYTMNYYIVHSTARFFVDSTGAHPAYSATIIGAASVGALLGAALQCSALSKQHMNVAWSSLALDFYRRSLLWAAFWPFLGNLLYTLGISFRSIPLVVFGRILIGFGSAELLNKSILSQSLPSIRVVPESVLLVRFQLSGVVIGLLLGACFALFDLDVGAPFGQAHVTTLSSFYTGSAFMAMLWMIHWVRLYFSFQKSNDWSPLSTEPPSDFVDQDMEMARGTPSFEAMTANSDSDDREVPITLMYRSNSDDASDDELNTTYADNLEAAYGTSSKSEAPKLPVDPDKVQEHKRTSSRDYAVTPRRRPLRRQWKSFVNRILKVLAYNVAIPVTVAMVVFAKISHEIFFTSCAIITHRYFSWNGSHTGLLLGILSALCFPISFVSGRISTRYDERTVIKHSLLLVGLGLLTMVNWASILSLASHVRSLFQETGNRTYHPYDWVFGVYQYVLGLTLTFTGISALELANMSLLSKVAPITSSRHHTMFNCATIVTFLGLAGRVVGDVQILMVGLSHRLINTDIVNSLVIPMFLVSLALGYLVRRHFFFLI